MVDVGGGERESETLLTLLLLLLRRAALSASFSSSSSYLTLFSLGARIALYTRTRGKNVEKMRADSRLARSRWRVIATLASDVIPEE